MRAKIHTGRYDSKGNQRYSYICELKEKSKKQKCDCKNINGNELDELLIKKLKSVIVPKHKIANQLEKLLKNEGIKEENDELKYLQQTYAKNQRDLENLLLRIKYVDIELIGEINKEIKSVRQKNDVIKEKINLLSSDENKKNMEFSEKKVEKLVLEIIEKHFEKFSDLDIIEKRNLLKLLINKLEGSGKNVQVILNNEI